MFFKECPKRNGYFSKADGFTCDKRDEHGLRLRLTPDNCQKACDANPDCISFEIWGGEDCNLSSTCTYELAHPDGQTQPSLRQCLYVKQGHKTFLLGNLFLLEILYKM